MVISKSKYMIATHSHPMFFISDNGEEVNTIEEAADFNHMENAQSFLSTFDEPANFKILHVRIDYEF